MRSHAIWLLALTFGAAQAGDLAADIYAAGRNAEPGVSLPQWNGRHASFSGKVSAAPDDGIPPTLSVAAGGHANLLVTCRKAIAHANVAVDSRARLDGVISDVRRFDQTQGAVGMWLLALSGGATLLSAPPVVVTLDQCRLTADDGAKGQKQRVRN
ncbi:MAG: hypothetical protein KGJ78_16330 [Alphaproteobacteria bacterium]|nr:hypothetical protein [Alphaproteobacteria bacterium]